MLFVVTGCGGGDTSPSPGRAAGDIERLTVAGQAAVVITPTAKTQRVVVYVHGSGESVENIFRDPRKEAIFDTLLGAGYAIAATDAHGDNWGSAAGERDQLALVEALRERGLGDLYVLALSMGGFNGLQMLDDVPVRAWAGIFPACDLALGLRAGPVPRPDPRRVRADGNAPGRPDRAAQPGRLRPARRAADALLGVGRRPRHPDGAEHRRVRGAGPPPGARVEVTATRGDHGDASNYDAAGVLRLFESAGG